MNLDVYSPEEMEAGFEILARVSGFESAEAMKAASKLEKLSDKQAKELMSQLDNFITSIFTPARLKQLRVRIDTLSKDPQYKGKWFPFLMLLKDRLADKKAVEYEKRFLIQALFGEMQAMEKEKNDREDAPGSEQPAPGQKDAVT